MAFICITSFRRGRDGLMWLGYGGLSPHLRCEPGVPSIGSEHWLPLRAGRPALGEPPRALPARQIGRSARQMQHTNDENQAGTPAISKCQQALDVNRPWSGRCQFAIERGGIIPFGAQNCAVDGLGAGRGSKAGNRCGWRGG